MRKKAERSEEVSYQSTFVVGIIPVTLKAGSRFSAGIEYEIDCDTLNAYGYYRPTIAAEAFAQAGVDAIILEVGVYCRLLLLESAIDFSSSAFVTDDSPEYEGQEQYVFEYGVNSEFTALSGEVGIYVELWLVVYTKRWKLPLFKWDGISAKGYLGEAPRVTYCLLNDPEKCKDEVSGGPPAVTSDWQPASHSQILTVGEVLPGMAEFNNRIISVMPSREGNGKRLVYQQMEASELRDGKISQAAYQSFDRSKTAVPGITEAVMESPELVVFGDYMYAFFKEIHGGSHGIKYTALNKEGKWTTNFWAGRPVVHSYSKPTATVFNDKLYLFYTKPGDGRIYYVTATQAVQAALQWSPERLLTTAISTDAAPSAVTFVNAMDQEKLMIFYKLTGRPNIYFMLLKRRLT